MNQPLNRWKRLQLITTHELQPLHPLTIGDPRYIQTSDLDSRIQVVYSCDKQQPPLVYEDILATICLTSYGGIPYTKGEPMVQGCLAYSYQSLHPPTTDKALCPELLCTMQPSCKVQKYWTIISWPGLDHTRHDYMTT